LKLLLQGKGRTLAAYINELRVIAEHFDVDTTLISRVGLKSAKAKGFGNHRPSSILFD